MKFELLHATRLSGRLGFDGFNVATLAWYVEDVGRRMGQQLYLAEGNWWGWNG
ncbi:hypothetical protein [Photobacterium sp. J15]|uniref:hypothetical protein n=1 Tax=Photobacterium sp. J15 TaxID=265901 RepID=UPI0012EDEC3F|nr:hypothetical protein [Photobacterium sp. J15]